MSARCSHAGTAADTNARFISHSWKKKLSTLKTAPDPAHRCAAKTGLCPVALCERDAKASILQRPHRRFAGTDLCFWRGSLAIEPVGTIPASSSAPWSAQHQARPASRSYRDLLGRDNQGRTLRRPHPSPVVAADVPAKRALRLIAAIDPTGRRHPRASHPPSTASKQACSRPCRPPEHSPLQLHAPRCTARAELPLTKTGSHAHV